MSIGLHHCVADVESCLAFKEATFYNISSDEIDGWTEQIGQEPRLLATFIVRLRAQLREVELLFAEGFGRVPGVMQQVAIQQGLLWLAFVIQPFVDEAFPLCEATPPEANLGLGIKAAPLYPLSAVVVEAVHGKDFVFGDFLVFQCFDGMLQFVRERFVGIDGEDEVTSGKVVGEVLLVGVAEPVLREELHTIMVADGLGRIGGMAVHDDDFVCDILQGIKTLSYFLFLVEGDDDDRKRVHAFKISAKVVFFFLILLAWNHQIKYMTTKINGFFE